MGAKFQHHKTVAHGEIMRKPPSGDQKLPPQSRKKLMQLFAEATEARDRHLSLTKMLNDLVAKVAYQGEQKDEQLSVMLERTRAQQIAAREADIMWRDLAARLSKFVDSLFYHRVSKYQPDRVRVGKTTGDIRNRIEALRAKVENLIYERRKAQAAPMSRGERTAKAQRFLAELARESAPSLHVTKEGAVELYLGVGRERLSPELAGVRRVLGGAIALVGVDEALKIMLPPQKEDREALSSEERKRRIAAISAELLEVEREEEACIEQAQADGQTILRRPDADPRAVLGIVVGE